MNSYILLVRQAIENYIKKRKIISPPTDLAGEFLTQRAGTFVTIEKNGNLRGCIGTYLPTKENIAQEIIHNAIAAATEDYRFGPIQKEELPYLSYTVYILNEPELVKDLKELDPQKYGIIVKTVPITQPRLIRRGSPERAANGTDVMFNGHLPSKTGLLLPDLEGVNTIEKQIYITCQKGGIDPAKEQVMIYKFTVKKYI